MIRRAAAPCGALAASAWLARPRAEADGGAPKPARRFEREWRKLERLGSGAFAEVFLVERAGPQDGGGPGAAGPQRAAAKLMSAAHAGVLAREVGAMRRTGLHPNLVGLLDEYSDGAPAPTARACSPASNPAPYSLTSSGFCGYVVRHLRRLAASSDVMAAGGVGRKKEAGGCSAFGTYALPPSVYQP